MGSFGLLFYGPYQYKWYGALDKQWPSSGWKNFVTKVTLNQIALSPVVLAVVFSWNLALTGKRRQLGHKIRSDLVPTMLNGWKFWVPAASINFALIPVQSQHFLSPGSSPKMKATGFTAVFTSLLKMTTLVESLIGLGFVIFGCVLQTPPKAPLPAALVAVGVLTLIASVLGYAGAHFRPQLLLAYLVIGLVGTFAQFIVVLAIFFSQSRVAAAIQNTSSEQSAAAPYLRDLDRQYIVEKLVIGKWIFLWVVLGEAAGLGVALAMRLMGRLEGKYENLELEEVNRLHDTELQAIGSGLTSSKKVSSRDGDRLSAKMQKKYGQSSGVDFMEGRRWYNIGK